MKNLIPIIIALLIAISSTGNYTQQINDYVSVSASKNEFTITIDGETDTYYVDESVKFEVERNQITIICEDGNYTYYIEN